MKQKIHLTNSKNFSKDQFYYFRLDPINITKNIMSELKLHFDEFQEHIMKNYSFRYTQEIKLFIDSQIKFHHSYEDNILKYLIDKNIELCALINYFSLLNIYIKKQKDYIDRLETKIIELYEEEKRINELKQEAIAISEYTPFIINNFKANVEKNNASNMNPEAQIVLLQIESWTNEEKIRIDAEVQNTSTFLLEINEKKKIETCLDNVKRRNNELSRRTGDMHELYRKSLTQSTRSDDSKQICFAGISKKSETVPITLRHVR